MHSLNLHLSWCQHEKELGDQETCQLLTARGPASPPRIPGGGTGATSGTCGSSDVTQRECAKLTQRVYHLVHLLPVPVVFVFQHSLAFRLVVIVSDAGAYHGLVTQLTCLSKTSMPLCGFIGGLSCNVSATTWRLLPSMYLP
eukprot:751957-Hanusia_phi.AAC.1